MGRKQQRSLRKAKLFAQDDDEGEEEEEGGLNLAPASLIAARKQKSKTTSAATVGSRYKSNGKYGEYIGKIQLRVAAPGHAPPVASGPTFLAAAAGEYTSEKMKELAKLTSVKPAEDVRVKGSFVRSEALGDQGGSQDEDGVSGFRGADVDMPLPPPPRAEEGQPAVPMEIDIPDEEYIRAAREKRERSRQRNMKEEEYIPIDDGRRLSALQARLAQKHHVSKQEIADRLEEEGGDLGDENAELEQWMQSQIRKGMTSGLLREDNMARSVGVQKRPTDIAAPMQVSMQMDSKEVSVKVLERLRTTLQRVKLSVQQTEKNLAQTKENISQCDARIIEDESIIEQLKEEFIVAQEMRVYISSLCAMLSEKSPIVEELQDQLLHAREERAAAQWKRSYLLYEEDLLIAKQSIEAAMEVLNKGRTVPEARRAAQDALHAAQRDLEKGTHIPVELDEFGRDLNTSERMKVGDRVQKRHAAFLEIDTQFINRQGEGSLEWKEPILGEVSSSESEDEISRFTDRRHDVQEECQSLFEDAEDDFASIEAIKRKLESWKRSCPNQYQSTFMGLSAPALFAPFVRLELLGWDPIDPTAGTFSQLSWYTTLFTYGADADESDPDHEIIPRLVCSIILPYVSEIADRIWNPASPSQCRALASTVEDLFVYVEPGHQALTSLIDIIQNRFIEAIGKCHIPSWAPIALSACPRAEVVCGYHFGLALRLFKGLLYFKECLPLSFLDNYAFNKVAREQAMPYIRKSLLDYTTFCLRMVRLLRCIPSDWMSRDTKNSPPLRDFMTDVVKQTLSVCTKLEEALTNEQAKQSSLHQATTLMCSLLSMCGTFDRQASEHLDRLKSLHSES